MKMFRFMLVFAMVVSLSSFAHAGSIHAVIVDPPFSPSTYDLLPGDTQIPAMDFNFGNCNAGQLTRLPSGFNSSDSCFEVYNDSGAAVTGVNLQFTAPVSTFGSGGSVTCAGLFSVTSCTETNIPSSSNGFYDLDFGGGSVANGGSFIIAVESPVNDFNNISITSNITTTPEPSSVALLSTGIFALAGFTFFKRGSLNLGASRL